MVRPSMPLKIGGQFTQTNKNQPRAIHYKNNFFFFLKKHLLFYFTILACILLFTYSPHFKLMIFYDLNHQIN